MSPFSLRKKKDIEAPSTSTPASGLASYQVTQQLQFPTNSQSRLQSPLEKQQSQPLYPWSAHTSPSEQWSPLFPRRRHAISATATAAGELLLFGGISNDDIPSGLYVISTRDFSTTILQTSEDVPSPRYGHCAMLTSTIFFIWGGTSDKYAQNPCNDHFYLLNLVSREWTRIVVNCPGPGGRYYHSMTLVGSKLFVFGGRTGERRFNDIWALDLNCLKSNPFWELYDPAPGNKKPLPRASHVSVTTDDRIIIFGGHDGTDSFNDTWSYNILTRKWTELQCTGFIPSPRAGHAAVLVGDVMYVFGGCAADRTYLGDLTALNLTTQRWITFQDTGPRPSRRFGHAMACDGTRVFVLGGLLSPGVHADETKLIHVLDTQHLVPEPDSDAVNPSKKTAQLVGRSSASPPTRGQPHQPSSSSDVYAALDASPFPKATLGERVHSSLQIARERNCGLSDLPSRSMGARGKPRGPRRVPEEGEASKEYYDAKVVVPDALSGKEIARLVDGRLIELERQLSETVVAKAERDRRIGQLTDELALKSALLAQAVEEKERVGQELRKLQSESLVSRDHALEQAEANATEATTRGGLGLEQRELQAKFDESLLSHDHTLKQAEANAAEEKRHAGLEQRERQAKLDKLMLSCDEHSRTLEQAQSALQKATSRAADADERSQPACEHGTELAAVRAELEGKKSELAAVLLRLADAEDGWAKSKAEAGTLRAGTQVAAGLVNMDVDRVMRRLMERVRAVEAEMVSLRGNEKNLEDMECRNEG